MLSIVIPAYNESDCIANTLTSLLKPDTGVLCEVTVVDNGSTDNTKEVAERNGATVIDLPSGTIAAVRNFGVLHCHADTLVFLDADVIVTPDWHENIVTVISDLAANPMQVCGSRCLPQSLHGFLNRYWYSRLNQYSASYINSGHLITSRLLFEKTGGFDESLVTAEDYDFCLRAKNAGAIIAEHPELKVIHAGYPDTIIEFIKREKWHGTEDYKSLRSFCSSKIAWVSLVHLMLFLLAIACALVSQRFEFLFVYIALSALLCSALTIVKFGTRNLICLPGTALAFYFYIVGRSLALVSRVFKQKNRNPPSK